MGGGRGGGRIVVIPNHEAPRSAMRRGLSNAMHTQGAKKTKDIPTRELTCHISVTYVY